MKKNLEFEVDSFLKCLENKQVNVEEFIGGLKRFIHRFLIFEVSNLKADDFLFDHLIRMSLWNEKTFPQLENGEDLGDLIEDIVPNILLVKHAFELLQLIELKNKEKSYNLKDIQILSNNPNHQSDPSNLDEEEEEEEEDINDLMNINKLTNI